MADVIKKSTNKFTKGLVMDFSPENTRNEVLTHALNATLLTFNGNELSLQNDMGNARVETAYLPEGYIPVGTCEYGGIIYIVSYNPLEDKSQIGCFPSPERNISNDELGAADIESLTSASFQKMVDNMSNIPTGTITNNAKYILLKEDHLNPGDKFIVSAGDSIYNEKLENLTKDAKPIANPVLALNIVSIEDSGKIIYLNSDLRTYDKVKMEDDKEVTYTYHILGEKSNPETGFVDIDSYRNVVSSGYNVFRSKTSGRLALLAELVMIDSYSVTHSVRPSKDINGDPIVGSFDVLLHTEVTPTLNSDNFNIAPKLSYYYLQNSQGYLTKASASASSGVEYVPLYIGKNLNDKFLETRLTDVYTPSGDINLGGIVSDTGKFRFPYADTYQGKMLEYTDLLDPVPDSLYTFMRAGCYHRIEKDQIINATSNHLAEFISQDIKFYVHDPEGGDYKEVDPKEPLSDDKEYFINDIIISWEDAERKVEYKNRTLYEQAINPTSANNNIVDDITIQKYLKSESNLYLRVNFEDITSDMEIYIQNPDNTNKYDKVDTPTKGQSYYELIVSELYYEVSQLDAEQAFSAGSTVYYYPAEPTYQQVATTTKEEYWDFERFQRSNSAPWGYKKILYLKIEQDNFIPAPEEALKNYYKEGSEILYYKEDYKEVNLKDYNGTYQLFAVPYRNTFLPSDVFIPDPTKNYITGYEPKPSKPGEYDYASDGWYYDVPISLFTLADYIPQHSAKGLSQYEDVHLGTLKLPKVAVDNELDFPFKYNYTVVPCMNYGKLDHLAVSNTVDFSQLHAFHHSNFNTWKYHIDDSQLRLTFGAEVFDTFEDNKVDSIILEFYDLWGFVGSLEINDKKSYSGVFTKLITLNTPNALSKTVIVNNKYVTNYKHNISITPKDGNFYLNDVSVYWTPEDGWSVADEYNDCGMLYANAMYGVKTYLRQTTSDGYKFTRKKDFFLYTIPIFNDFYYTVNDFSTIENPTVDLMLTYKLTDASTRSIFNSNKITNGYHNDTDYGPVTEYLQGSYQESILTGTKYYSYTGVSNLNLEIGLKQDYQQFGLSYAHEINDLFSCTLQLISDDVPERTFTVKSGDTASPVALNYKEGTDLTIESNQITFGALEQSTINKVNIKTGDFAKYNFISKEPLTSIPIRYRFIVGYPYTVMDIKKTEVPATTVCALMHKNERGTYNLEDFGLHDLSTDPDNPIYTSNRMFMNAGTHDTEVFGIVAHVKLTGTALEQYERVDSMQRGTIPRDLNNSKALNSGEPMQLAGKYIGKLTFMQPHAHNNWTNYDNGVNITYDDNGGRDTYKWKLSSAVCAGQDVQEGRGTNSDDIHGVKPSDAWARNPCYNMTVNTLNSINNYSESISTLHYEEAYGIIWGWDVNDYGKDSEWDTKNYNENKPQRRFVGFTGEQLSDFYTAFTNTMKSIYARNIDYDSIPLQIGTAKVDENPLSFVSHLISVESTLTFEEGKVFNDYLYLGPISFTAYFTNMQNYSNTHDSGIIIYEHASDTSKPIPAVNFNPSYTYLGKADSIYLVTSLTYNTSAPMELVDQLEVNTDKAICVKHSDGSYTFVSGEAKSNALYGYDSDSNKLVQLDVSNYKIKPDGFVQLIKELEAGSFGFTVDTTPEIFSAMINDGYGFKQDLRNTEFGNSTVSGAMALQYISQDKRIAIDPQLSTAYYWLGLNSSTSVKTTSLIKFESAVNASHDGFTYSDPAVNFDAIKQGGCVDLVGITLSGIDVDLEWLQNQDYSFIAKLFFGDYNESISFSYRDSEGALKTYDGILGNLRTDASSVVELNGSGSEMVVRQSQYSKPILIAVKLIKLPYQVTRSLEFAQSSENIIHVTPTKEYSEVNANHSYVVLDKYKLARFRGTSVVVNDLYYDGLSSGHRLYMKADPYFYDKDVHRGRIYYRNMSSYTTWSCSSRGSSGVRRGSSDYSNYNNLCVHTGPCFILDNLYETKDDK